MASSAFDRYNERFIGRHQSTATHLLATAGDVVAIGFVVVGVTSRRRQLAYRGAVVGLAITAIAHLFQPGTLGEELRAIGRHPLWALRAEARRVRSLSPVSAG
jgi:hypothetical protein